MAIIGARPGRLDAVIGGPPCQGFSAAGRRLPHEPKNYLYRPFGTLARNLGARLLVMENVPGVRQVNGTRFVHRILTHFRRLGYLSESFLLTATNYGVPQDRRRLIFIGIAKHLGVLPSCPRPKFAGPSEKRSSLPRPPTVRDVLRHLPRIGAGGGSDILQFHGHVVLNHWAMKHSPAVISKIRRIPPGKGPISYKRLTWGYAGTLIAGHRALPVHPRIPRTITVREAARIQTIPDHYRFLGPRSTQPLQVADAVPFRLALVLAEHAHNLVAGSPLWRKSRNRRGRAGVAAGEVIRATVRRVIQHAA
jgi:DNA (cytosine-5)-methyltransferase 1